MTGKDSDVLLVQEAKAKAMRLEGLLSDEAKRRLGLALDEVCDWATSEAGTAILSGWRLDLPRATETMMHATERAVQRQFPKATTAERDVLMFYCLARLAKPWSVQRMHLKHLLPDVQGKLDGMNEMSEMTSLRLQMTMDRRSKFISTLSQMMKKSSTTQEILVQNIK